MVKVDPEVCEIVYARGAAHDTSEKVNGDKVLDSDTSPSLYIMDIEEEADSVTVKLTVNDL
jgi:hypothetical protein